MIRVATWFESQLGRNDGNPLYVTVFLKRAEHFCNILLNRPSNPKLGFAFPDGKTEDARAEEFARWFLKEIDPDGLEVHHIRPWGDYKTFGEFDLNIWVDWGEDGLQGLLPYTPIYPPAHPLIYWASDTHLGYDYRLARAKEADLVFCAQERAVEEFRRNGVEAAWLPHAVEPLAYPKFELASKRYDVCFVGHINSQNRIDALDRLFREFPNFYYGQLLFEKAARKYAESKVIFNISHMDDINMRCFEVMATGSFLLTNNIPTLNKLFKHGTHLAVYDNLDSAISQVKHYLTYEKEREEIAQDGCKEVLKNHTFLNRMKQVFQAVKEKGLLKREVVNVSRTSDLDFGNR